MVVKSVPLIPTLQLLITALVGPFLVVGGVHGDPRAVSQQFLDRLGVVGVSCDLQG
jgi:hypothetical protein